MGVLAHRGNLSTDAAFDRLRRYARNNNLRLSDVARNVVETDLAADILAPRGTGRPKHR
ncbi:ANTAR domain-containing protein [Pseudonocardia sp.]|uniref:ANTAR domain-containing protein n=1 Tax=Pseudonocardia sp. TaxID=60912 RepID=UPI00345D16F8